MYYQMPNYGYGCQTYQSCENKSYGYALILVLFIFLYQNNTSSWYQAKVCNRFVCHVLCYSLSVAKLTTANMQHPVRLIK